eukprot:bmy_18613T0
MEKIWEGYFQPFRVYNSGMKSQESTVLPGMKSQEATQIPAACQSFYKDLAGEESRKVPFLPSVHAFLEQEN